MSDGRTVWFAKDAAWWRREAIVALLDEFGCDGPAVVDWLTCEAKAQNDGGLVKSGFRSISRGLGVDMSRCVPIVSRAVELGLLDDFKDSGLTFECRISGWEAEQVRALEAVKKRRQRAAAKGENGSTEPNPDGDAHGPNGTRPDMSPSVPSSPPTGQDRTEETTTPLTPQGGPLLPGPPPDGNRRRDVERWRAQAEAFAAQVFPELKRGAAMRCLSQAAGRGGVGWNASPDDYRAWAVGTAWRKHFETEGAVA